MSLIPKQFMDSVVLISTQNDSYRSFATGFFVGRKFSENTYCIYLVTNKHVIENEKSLNLWMIHKNKEETISFPIDLYDEVGQPKYYLNSNKKVDVAVIKLPVNSENLDNSDFNFINIDENTLISEELINNDNAEGSLVYMLGFPMSTTFDNSSLKPISRLGSIARMNKKEILKQGYAWADIQNFKGNSGSPILLRPELMHLNGTNALEKSALIGVVCGYAPYKNKVKENKDKETEFFIEENSGLAGFVPIEYVIQIIDKIQPKI